MRELDADSLSWAALLAQCTDFARASAALTGDGEDDERWRACTGSIIALMSVTHALRSFDRLEDGERPFARDRAELIIGEHAGTLDAAWRGVPMPESLLELAGDARTALERSCWVGATEMVWTGPGTFVVPPTIASLPDRIAAGEEPSEGTLMVMQPGTLVMPGEPVAWWTERPWPDVGDAFDALDAVDTDAPRQVYRGLDANGRIEGDVTAPIWHEPRAGLPLLVPLLAAGTAVGTFTLSAEAWEAQQRSALGDDPDAEPVPVTEVGSVSEADGH